MTPFQARNAFEVILRLQGIEAHRAISARRAWQVLGQLLEERVVDETPGAGELVLALFTIEELGEQVRRLMHEVEEARAAERLAVDRVVELGADLPCVVEIDRAVALLVGPRDGR